MSGHGDSIREWRARKIWAEEWEEEEEVFEEEWEEEEEEWWEEEETGPGRSSLPNGRGAREIRKWEDDEDDAC